MELCCWDYTLSQDCQSHQSPATKTTDRYSTAPLHYSFTHSPHWVSHYLFLIPLRVEYWVGLSMQWIISLLKAACSGLGKHWIFNQFLDPECYEHCSCLGLYQIWLFQIRMEPDLARFRNSNPARAGYWEKLYSDHRTIHLMKLMTSTMLSVATKRHYISVLPLLCQFASFWENLWNSNEFCIFRPGNTN